MVLAVRFVIKILEPEQPLRKCHLAPFAVTQHGAVQATHGSGVGAATGTGTGCQQDAVQGQALALG